MTKDRSGGRVRSLVRAARFRFLKRFHRPGRRVWWAFNRSSVSLGVAVGLFCGVLTPVAQIVFAIILAIAMRANLLVAAASTFVTNPVTLPFIYYYAYRIGTFLTGPRGDIVDDVAVSEEAAEQALEVAGWLATLTEWVSAIALPFMVGVLCLALASALLGYLLVQAAWTAYAGVLEYRRRRERRASASATAAGSGSRSCRDPVARRRS